MGHDPEGTAMILDPAETIRAIFNNAPIGIARVRKRTIEWANEALRQATGYSWEDLKGKSVRHLYQSDDEYRRAGEALYRDGWAETTIQTKDGRSLHVSLWAPPPIDGDTHVVVVYDIARQRQAENALRLTQFSVDNALDPIIWLGRRGEIIYVNHAACKAVGYTRDELLSMSVFDVALDMSTEQWEELWEARKEQDGLLSEIGQRRKDGSVYWAEVSSRYLQYNGNEYVWVTIRDITKRKRAQESLEERERELQIKSHNLEEANAALRVLLRHRDEGKEALVNNMLANVRELVSPYIEKLGASHLSDVQRTCLGLIESGLSDIVSPFVQKMTSAYSHFTPTEVQIANLIKGGKTSKEIAKLMNVCTGTIEVHRNNIRKKLGLNNKSINLQTYLLSM